MTSQDPLLRPAPAGIERRPVTAATRVLLGGPVALVTTSWRGRANVMPLAWHTPLSADPALVGIAVEQSRYTADVIRHSQEFALNIPPRPLLHHVQYLGAMRGEDVDKFEATQLETFAPTHVTAPLIAGCVAWLECEVQEVLTFGDHDFFVALVAAVHVDPAAFGDRWLPERTPEESRPLHFLGGHDYSSLHRLFEAKLPGVSEAPERVLRERLAEELELTREARERREERRAELERELERGHIVDVSELEPEFEVEADERLDLSKGLILGERPEE
jgi:flavin reductase (DIM6/NTAB) family NADH-FMN oxidoreductase RutF